MTTLQKGLEHPAWCDRQHGTSPTHVADIGDVEVGDGCGFAVHVMHYPRKDAAVIPVALWTPDDDTVMDLTAEQARQLGEYLLAAADALDGRVAR